MDKLPRWARMRIEKLEADIAYERERVLAMSTDGADAGYPFRVVEDMGGRRAQRTLPHLEIECDMGDGAAIRLWRNGAGLEVNLSHGRLLVRPRASNTVTLLREGRA